MGLTCGAGCGGGGLRGAPDRIEGAACSLPGRRRVGSCPVRSRPPSLPRWFPSVRVPSEVWS